MNVELWEGFYIRSEKSGPDRDVIGESFAYPIFRSGQPTWPYAEWTAKEDWKPEVVVDVGGCIGAFSVISKRLWPDSYVITLEPDKENFEMCEANLRHQCGDDGSWKVYDAALNYYPEKNKFLKSISTSGGGFLIDSDKIPNNRNYSLQENSTFTSLTLRQILELTPNGKIDILKLDCEGGENGLVFSEEVELLKDIPYIVGEWHGFELSDRPPAPYCNSKFVNILIDVLSETHNVVAYDPRGGDHIGNFWCYAK